MLKVVINCLNSKYVHYSSAPWCLLAGVRQNAKSQTYCLVLQSTINSDIDAFADSIICENPDVFSFSCYIWNITQTLYICQKIKNAKPHSVCVLGGPEVAYRPKSILTDYPFVDYVLTGEGEYCFPEFLDMLSGLCDKESVSGLTYRSEISIISNSEKCYDTTPPSPFCDEYFKALDSRICYIESSRGCPYRCAFCLSGRVSKLRFFDINQTKSDIIKLSQSGTQTIKFVDRTFNASEKHANEILSFIKENYGSKIPQGVCFHFEIAGDILKESTFEILEKMPKGAIQLEIGMQSFNEQTLLNINRKTNTKKLIQNIKRLIAMGNMHIHIDLIAGLTGEDMQSFETSFDIAYSLNAHMLQMGFLKLLYGAAMREESEKYPCEFNETPPYEVISTPWITKEQMLTLKKTEDAVDRMYNSGRFLFTLDYLINEVGFTPFKLFYEFGQRINAQKMSLCEYTEAIYNYFSDKCDKNILREKLVCDLLCSGNQLPKTLRFENKLHKKAKALLGKNTKLAILPQKNKIFTVDTNSGKDFFGRFDYKYFDIDILGKNKE